MRPKIIGTVHNAKICTFDGRDCWISALCDERGKFLYGKNNVEEHDTEEQAREWVRVEAQRRDMELLEIRDTTTWTRR
jgi:hypothetical protein